MKPAIFNDEEYQEILAFLNELISEADGLPYPNAKDLVFSILKYFDSIHREPLSRMMTFLDENYPEARNTLQSDLSIHTMLGLYELLKEEKPPESEKMVGFVPLEQVTLLNPEKKKEWLEVGYVSDLKEKQLYPKHFARVNFLVSKVNEEVFAIQNQCVHSILPIDQGKLEGHILICPWHGCRYDLRTGKEVDEPDKQLEVFPTEVEADGLLKVEISYF